MFDSDAVKPGVARRLGRFAGRAATPALIGYDVVTEEGTGEDDKHHYKTGRLVNGVASAAVYSGVTALGTAAGVAGAPAVAVGAAAVGLSYGAYKIGSESIENAKIYAVEDKRFQASQDLRHIKSMQYRLRDTLLARGATFDEDGRIDLTNAKNKEIMQAAIAEKQAELRRVAKENSSILPRWMRPGIFSDSIHRYNAANSDLAIFEAAEKELDQFKTMLAADRAKRPAPQQSAPAQSASSTQTAPSPVVTQSPASPADAQPPATTSAPAETGSILSAPAQEAARVINDFTIGKGLGAATLGVLGFSMLSAINPIVGLLGGLALTAGGWMLGGHIEQQQASGRNAPSTQPVTPAETASPSPASVTATDLGRISAGENTLSLAAADIRQMPDQFTSNFNGYSPPPGKNNSLS